jgi:hypothetical protein
VCDKSETRQRRRETLIAGGRRVDRGGSGALGTFDASGCVDERRFVLFVATVVIFAFGSGWRERHRVRSSPQSGERRAFSESERLEPLGGVRIGVGHPHSA